MFLATPPCFNTLSFLTMVTTFAPERVIVCLTLRLASVFIFIFFVYVMAQRQQYCDRGGWDGQREDHAAHAVPTRGRLHQLRDGGMHAATQSCSHERGQASERGDEQQPGRGGELRFLLNALHVKLPSKPVNALYLVLYIFTVLSVFIARRRTGRVRRFSEIEFYYLVLPEKGKRNCSFR